MKRVILNLGAGSAADSGVEILDASFRPGGRSAADSEPDAGVPTRGCVNSFAGFSDRRMEVRCVIAGIPGFAGSMAAVTGPLRYFRNVNFSRLDIAGGLICTSNFWLRDDRLDLRSLESGWLSGRAAPSSDVAGLFASFIVGNCDSEGDTGLRIGLRFIDLELLNLIISLPSATAL